MHLDASLEELGRYGEVHCPVVDALDFPPHRIPVYFLNGIVARLHGEICDQGRRYEHIGVERGARS